METFIDLLFGNTLTLLVFFPALACVPLLFFPKESSGAVLTYLNPRDMGCYFADQWCWWALSIAGNADGFINHNTTRPASAH